MGSAVRKGRILGKQVVHANPYFRVVEARVEVPNGEIWDPYYFAEYARESVAIVPVRARREVLLIQAWRPTTEQIGWEVPAGLIERQETAEDAARRELREETGWEATDLCVLGSFYTSNATSTERVQAFIAAEPRALQAMIDEREVLSVRWVPAEEVTALICSNQITDGVSLTTLLLAFHLCCVETGKET